MFDTHCHLVEYGEQICDVLAESRQVGIKYFLSICARFTDWYKQLMFCQQEGIFLSCGIHPFYLSEVSASLDVELIRFINQYPQAVIGEIGLDFYDKQLSRTQKDQQITLFEQQVFLANQFCRPIVLHQRKAISEIIPIIRRYNISGFAHGFSGSLEEARQLLNCGLMIGIGSVLLRENAHKIRNTLRYLPTDQFVLETDAPFMLRERNFPKNLGRIAQIVADIRQVELSELQQQTTYNALKVLNS